MSLPFSDVNLYLHLPAASDIYISVIICCVIWLTHSMFHRTKIQEGICDEKETVYIVVIGPVIWVWKVFFRMLYEDVVTLHSFISENTVIDLCAAFSFLSMLPLASLELGYFRQGWPWTHRTLHLSAPPPPRQGLKVCTIMWLDYLILHS